MSLAIDHISNYETTHASSSSDLSSSPTEQECISSLDDRRYHNYYNLDQQFQMLVKAFKECRNKASLEELHRQIPEFEHQKIYWLLDLWSSHPNTYFNFGRVIKRYPVSKAVDAIGHIQHHTNNTLPYFQTFEKQGCQSVTENQNPNAYPIWLYIPSDHPLARSRTIEECIRQRPFLEEILLNGRVTDPSYN